MVIVVMMMMVLTYDVDLHITLLRPRSKHLKGGRLARVEVANLGGNKDWTLMVRQNLNRLLTHRVSDKLALVRSALVRGQLGRGWCWSRFWW